MDDFKIFIGTHCAAAIVFLLADNMNFADVERVGSANNRADIEVVLDVLNGDFQRRTSAC